jgi:hypothetical protein
MSEIKPNFQNYVFLAKKKSEYIEIAKCSILLDNTPQSKSHGLNLKMFSRVFLCLINPLLPKILSLVSQSCISLDPLHIIKTLRILEVRAKIILVYFLLL